MKLFYLNEFNQTGLVSAFYTPKGYGGWDYPDEPSLQRYEELAACFGISTEQIVRTKQTHTSAVKAVAAENGGEGVCIPFGAMGFDGMVTNTRKLMLCTKEADCVPVYLLDPAKKAIGMVHSGWRGTVGQISVQAIKLMQDKYACNPKDILIGIGPHICRECYEVSEDLYAPFAEKYNAEEMKQLFIPEQGKPHKYLLNLQKAIELSVLKAGVLPEHFFKANYCTYHDGLFDSYRLNGGQDTRMLTGIMLL